MSNFVYQGGPPAWVLPGSTLDFDFQNHRYFQQGQSTAIENLFTVSRASTAYQDYQNSTWTSFPSNVLRVTDKGTLIEESSTNSIRNNSMQGAIVGTPGTLPTNWAGLGTLNGISASVIGTGTESGVDYIDLQFSGTATLATGYNINFETLNQIAAASGQTWSGGFFHKLVGGGLTGISSVQAQVVGSNGASGIENGAQSFTPTSAALGLSRVTNIYPLANVGTTNVRHRLVVNITNGGVVNITLRIGWPQLEQKAFVTSPIRTTSAAVTRAADVVTLTKVPSFGNSRTYFAKFTPTAGSSVLQGIVEGSDGTANNSDTVYLSSTATQANMTTKLGGVVGANLARTPTAVGTSAKVAAAVAASDQALVLNGGTATTAASADIISGSVITRVDIGDTEGTNRQLDGYVERIAIWPTTRLPNATLQAITA